MCEAATAWAEGADKEVQSMVTSTVGAYSPQAAETFADPARCWEALGPTTRARLRTMRSVVCDRMHAALSLRVVTLGVPGRVTTPAEFEDFALRLLHPMVASPELSFAEVVQAVGGVTPSSPVAALLQDLDQTLELESPHAEGFSAGGPAALDSLVGYNTDRYHHLLGVWTSMVDGAVTKIGAVVDQALEAFVVALFRDDRQGVVARSKPGEVVEAVDKAVTLAADRTYLVHDTLAATFLSRVLLELGGRHTAPAAAGRRAAEYMHALLAANPPVLKPDPCVPFCMFPVRDAWLKFAKVLDVSVEEAKRVLQLYIPEPSKGGGTVQAYNTVAIMARAMDANVQLPSLSASVEAAAAGFRRAKALAADLGAFAGVVRLAATAGPGGVRYGPLYEALYPHKQPSRKRIARMLGFVLRTLSLMVASSGETPYTLAHHYEFVHTVLASSLSSKDAVLEFLGGVPCVDVYGVLGRAVDVVAGTMTLLPVLDFFHVFATSPEVQALLAAVPAGSTALEKMRAAGVQWAKPAERKRAMLAAKQRVVPQAMKHLELALGIHRWARRQHDGTSGCVRSQDVLRPLYMGRLAAFEMAARRPTTRDSDGNWAAHMAAFVFVLELDKRLALGGPDMPGRQLFASGGGFGSGSGSAGDMSSSSSSSSRESTPTSSPSPSPSSSPSGSPSASPCSSPVLGPMKNTVVPTRPAKRARVVHDHDDDDDDDDDDADAGTTTRDAPGSCVLCFGDVVGGTSSGCVVHPLCAECALQTVRVFIQEQTRDVGFGVGSSPFQCMAEGCAFVLPAAKQQDLLGNLPLCAQILWYANAARAARAAARDACPACEEPVGRDCLEDPCDPVRTCSLCKATSCKRCRRAAHFGYPCPDILMVSRHGVMGVSDLLSEAKIVKCPTCGIPITKGPGCNHMKCGNLTGAQTPCGTDFCFLCGERINAGADMSIHYNTCLAGHQDSSLDVERRRLRHVLQKCRATLKSPLTETPLTMDVVDCALAAIEDGSTMLPETLVMTDADITADDGV